MSITTDHSYGLDPTEQPTGVSWGAIAAGAVVAAALSLALIALGVGLGLSAISPWSGSGGSATTFKIGSGVNLAVVAITRRSAPIRRATVAMANSIPLPGRICGNARGRRGRTT
jgi:hypothetical protein